MGEDQEERSATKEEQSSEAPSSHSRTDGLAALCLVARLHHVAADSASIAHQLSLPASQDVSISDLLLAAKHIGLKAKITHPNVERLPLSPLPALARVRNTAGGMNTVVLAQCTADRILLQDPTANGTGDDRTS